MSTRRTSRLAVAIGAAGLLAGLIASTVTPAFGVPASSTPMSSASKIGPIALSATDTTLVSLKLPSGRWLVTGKMWADSVASQPTGNTVVGCSIWQKTKLLDASAFNVPKVGGPGGTSAGANMVTAIVSLKSTTTITFKCDDVGSHANAHNVVLTAIG